jgi:hypothetical protein
MAFNVPATSEDDEDVRHANFKRTLEQ